MDEALAQLTREWLTKGLHDLQTARITANAAGGPLDTAIYHCQQAAEKSLKGWLRLEPASAASSTVKAARRLREASRKGRKEAH